MRAPGGSGPERTLLLILLCFRCCRSCHGRGRAPRAVPPCRGSGSSAAAAAAAYTPPQVLLPMPGMRRRPTTRGPHPHHTEPHRQGTAGPMADVVQGATVKQLQHASLKRALELFADNHGTPIPLDEDRCVHAVCCTVAGVHAERELAGAGRPADKLLPSPSLHLALAASASSWRARWVGCHA